MDEHLTQEAAGQAVRLIETLADLEEAEEYAEGRVREFMVLQRTMSIQMRADGYEESSANESGSIERSPGRSGWRDDTSPQRCASVSPMIPARFDVEYPERCRQLLEALEPIARKDKLLGSFSLLVAAAMFTIPYERLKARHPLARQDREPPLMGVLAGKSAAGRAAAVRVRSRMNDEMICHNPCYPIFC